MTGSASVNILYEIAANSEPSQAMSFCALTFNPSGKQDLQALDPLCTADFRGEIPLGLPSLTTC
jgi:hypothetical protein